MRREIDRGEVDRLALPGLTPQFVFRSIHARLPQIGLQRSDPAWLEHFDALERLQQRVLNEIVGVGKATRPLWLPSRSPTLKR